MKFSGSKDNKIKNGRIWCYNNNYSSSVGFEWSLRPLDIFNFNIGFDGGERDYTLTFWFIWVFYIRFSDIFKHFPREWNSMTNNGEGGFLNSARRKIGIAQYGSVIWFDIWHNGEDSWYREGKQRDWQNKKDFKIYHKTIFLKSIFIGDHKYSTLESDEDLKLELKLPEKVYNISVSYRYWNLKHNRWISRILNRKGKTYFINEENGIACPRTTFDGESESKNIPRHSYQIKGDDTHDDYLKELRKHIIKLRGGEEWIPKDYRLKVERQRKLKKLTRT